jgi:hypothetical protein
MAYTLLSSTTPNLNQRLVALGFPLGVLSLRVQLQLADRLRVAGFIVRCVKRESIHPVWSARMFAGNATNAHSIGAVRRQVWLALREVGIRLRCGEVRVRFSGALIEVSFIHASGSPGLVTISSRRMTLKPGACRKQHARRHRGADENSPEAEVIRPLWAARFPAM